MWLVSTAVWIRAAARQHRRDEGDADAAGLVAHQVEQAGGVAHRLPRDRRHRDRGQRHEQQAEREALEELRPEQIPVPGRQVEPRQPEIGEGAEHEAEPHQLAAVESLRSATPTSGIAMNEPMPRGAIAMPACSGGYPISVCSMTGSSTRLP